MRVRLAVGPLRLRDCKFLLLLGRRIVPVAVAHSGASSHILIIVAEHGGISGSTIDRLPSARTHTGTHPHRNRRQLTAPLNN